MILTDDNEWLRSLAKITFNWYVYDSTDEQEWLKSLLTIPVKSDISHTCSSVGSYTYQLNEILANGFHLYNHIHAS
jgi:hypothetical protein